MEQALLTWFTASGSFALLISLFINIVISILGFVPSFFLTAANITFFGFNKGLLISFLGEVIGAMASFILYRKGTKTIVPEMMKKSKHLQKLSRTQGLDSFLLIIMLRTFPFVPSGIVNLAAAISKTTLLTFTFASTTGKVPAMLIEGYSVKQVMDWTSEGKIILFIFALCVLFIYLRRQYNKNN